MNLSTIGSGLADGSNKKLVFGHNGLMLKTFDNGDSNKLLVAKQLAKVPSPKSVANMKKQSNMLPSVHKRPDVARIQTKDLVSINKQYSVGSRTIDPTDSGIKTSGKKNKHQMT